MNKIVILCMSCNNDFFNHEEEIIKQTWGKDILEGKYPNIDIWFFSGNAVRNWIDKDSHHIYMTVEDDWYHTFKKTKYAMKTLIDNGVEFDYLLRTNMSIYVNVSLLNCIANEANPIDNIIWCLELAKTSEYFFPAGKFVVMNKQHVDYIINNSDMKYEETHEADDTVLGKIFKELKVSYKTFKTIYYNYFTSHPYYDKIEDANIDKLRSILCVSVRSVVKDKATNKIVELYKVRENIEFHTMFELLKIYNGFDSTIDDAIKCIRYKQTSVYDIDNKIWYKIE